MQVTNKNAYPEAQIATEAKDYYNVLVSQGRENHYFQWFSKVRDLAKVDDKRSEYMTDF